MTSKEWALFIRCCCVGALLAEVSASPKPGLVDRYSNGAHKDMSFYTFLDSVTAISPYFEQCAMAGTTMDPVDSNSLDLIRPMGIRCEEVMFAVTGGVNTHKGAIFSLGIIAAAAGYCAVHLGDLRAETVCAAAGVIARPAERDFIQNSKAVTKGQELFAAYGIRGIRGEAASGFASVRRYALPVLRELFQKGTYHENEIYLQALLKLMYHVEDTNILARGGVDGLDFVRQTTGEVLSLGGALTQQGLQALVQLDEQYIEKNLSPGGCADLLSVAIALHRLEKPGITI